VAEVILDCPRIMPRIGQAVAAQVPQHMNEKPKRLLDSPSLFIRRLTASVVNGPPRSVVLFPVNQSSEISATSSRSQARFCSFIARQSAGCAPGRLMEPAASWRQIGHCGR
jgi:hypothetical protein